jgi:competence protein ComEC
MLKKSIAVMGLLSAGVLTAASPKVEIYWIDAEGGGATLIVGPNAQSMLVDTANRATEDRDAKRILAAAQLAGLKKIDILLTTHYHGDHVGSMAALSKMIPIDQYMDHGESVELDRPAAAAIYKAYVEQSQGKRKSLQPGDLIPMKGVKIQVVMAGGKPITRPLKGGGPNAALCKDALQKPTDIDPENNQSVGFLLTYGKFKFLDLGDLPWLMEQQLACPQNLIGTVDLYQTTHHGLDRSNSPQLVYALKPRVMVMNNGPRKGGPPAIFEILRKSPGVEDIWQGHLALGTPKEMNSNEQMIANFEPTAECKGNWLKASITPDGKYTITNGRNGFSKTYSAR